MRPVASLLLALSLLPAALLAPSSPLAVQNAQTRNQQPVTSNPGPYPVGFRVLNAYDRSRTSLPKFDYRGKPTSAERHRPLQISIWYPARPAAAARPMPFAAYVHLTAQEERFGPLSPQQIRETETRFFSQPFFDGLTPAQKQTLLGTPAAATRDAPPQPGPFPLLVFGQGLGYESAVAHSVICEYLASHGYIVATVPYGGVLLRQQRLDSIGLENEVRDLEFVIASMHDVHEVDPAKLGLVGFDFGGLAALLLAMRNTDVDALVSLDSGIMFQHNLALLKQSPFFDPLKLRVPLMQVTRTKEENAGYGLTEDFVVLHAPYSATWLLRFKGMTHADFTSYASIAAAASGSRDPASARKKRAYDFVCSYTLSFLDAHLKGEQESRLYLANDPAKNGAPQGMLTVEHKPAAPAPPTEAEFIRIIFDEGADRAAAIYRGSRTSDPACVLFKEDNLNLVGYQLLEGAKTKEAIKVFALNVEAFPGSWNAYDSLGEAYMRDGDKPRAIANYRRSLELNPKNTNAEEMLKKLEDK